MHHARKCFQLFGEWSGHENLSPPKDCLFKNNLVGGPGKLIGAMAALFGVFTLSLPIPIIVNGFSNCYKNRLWRMEVALRRAERLNNEGNIEGRVVTRDDPSIEVEDLKT